MPTIVDIHGLADLFSVNERTLQRTWEDYPKFFVGTGRDAKPARFVVEDVLACLSDRYYTTAEKNTIKKQKIRVGRPGQENSQRGGVRQASGVPRMSYDNWCDPGCDLLFFKLIFFQTIKHKRFGLSTSQHTHHKKTDGRNHAQPGNILKSSGP